MPRRLDLTEQVRIAAALAYRAEIFHATWFAVASREGRLRYRDALSAHAEILVMVQAAHMSALVTTLHSLFERSERTINLPGISKQLDNVAAKDLETCAPVAKKVAKLRHNIFAHRSGNLTQQEVYGLAAITSNDLRWLAGRAMAISRVFHQELDLQAPSEAIGARASITNLLDALGRDSA